MIKILKYFFYKIYSFSLSNGETDVGWAYAIVSIFLIANVYSLLDVIMIITESNYPKLNNLIIILMGGGILYFNYLFLLKDGKAMKIMEEFRKHQKGKAALNMILFFYVVASVIIFIWSGNVIRSMN